MQRAPVESVPYRFHRTSHVSSSRPVVLLVWDDPSFRASAQRGLEADGYDVRSFRVGASTPAHLSHSPVELVVLDATRRPQLALAFFEGLRAHDGALPVIVIAHANDGTQGEAARLGAAAVLDSPPDVSQVRRTATVLVPVIPGADVEVDGHEPAAH